MLESEAACADSSTGVLSSETIVITNGIKKYLNSIPDIISTDNTCPSKIKEMQIKQITKTKNKRVRKISQNGNLIASNEKVASLVENVGKSNNTSSFAGKPAVMHVCSKSPSDKTNKVNACDTTEPTDLQPQTKEKPTKDCHIATFVFFDLETTGLAHEVGKSNVHITEISMVAIDKKEFQDSIYSDLRDIRIMHKLSMCIRPRSMISPSAAKITGLNLENLSDQYTFDRNAATAVTSFLSHLPKPVCLLAHNGKCFDFPLIKAEFRRLNIPLPQDLLAADTLQAIRKIGLPDPPSKNMPKSLKMRNGKISCSLENLHIFFFKKKPFGSHSSEGDCIALAKVCHKMKDEILPWIAENSSVIDLFEPMW